MKSVAWFGDNVDITQTLGLTVDTDKRYNHSFEFNNDAATTWQYYAGIKSRLGCTWTY